MKEHIIKISNPFSRLTAFEKLLWGISVLVVALSFLLSPERDVLNFVASLLGVTALIFIARGFVIGQVLVIAFSTLYSIASYRQAYYGEMITYLAMTAPAAIAATVSWLKNPYKTEKEVKVASMTLRHGIIMSLLSVVVTLAFYFILRALGTANLFISTFSVLTSFVASYMTFIRVPYYALGYAINDLVLIALWSLSAVADTAYLPIVFCFVMFLFNDLYGFFSWRRMRTRQSLGE